MPLKSIDRQAGDLTGEAMEAYGLDTHYSTTPRRECQSPGGPQEPLMLHTPVESLSQDALKARDAYLALVHENYRSHTTNIFLEQARAGVVKPGDSLSRVLAVIKRKLDEASDGDEATKWRAILTTLARPEALGFAAYCVHYVNLPDKARRKLKAARQIVYAESYMEQQPVTAAQLGLLRKMGWQGDPPVSSRAEATLLIGAMLGQRGRRG
jgi:hypothetical protein